MKKGFTVESLTILERAMDYIKSVPYKVSSRWVFYRLYQDGLYKDKSDDKNKWIPLSSKARHMQFECSNGIWTRDIMADETRDTIYQGEGFYENLEEYVSAMADNVSIEFDPWYTQSKYVQIWYEARAMTEQFKYYAPHITFQPFGGEVSIPFKTEIMESLANASDTYETPLIVLYFGDLDTKGLSISEVGNRDISKWLDEDHGLNYEFIRCGLTQEQVTTYNVLMSEGGKFQWEALSDKVAEKIIKDSIEPYIDQDAFNKNDVEGKVATEKYRAHLKKLHSELIKKYY